PLESPAARPQSRPVRAGRGHTWNDDRNAANSPPGPPSRLPDCRNPRTRNGGQAQVQRLPLPYPLPPPRRVLTRPVGHAWWKPPPPPHTSLYMEYVGNLALLLQCLGSEASSDLNSRLLESIFPVHPGRYHVRHGHLY